MMRKGLTICSILFVASLSLTAQPGHGSPARSLPGTTHSNGEGVKDRDFGKDRAAGVGKKEGLEGDQGKRKGKGHKKHDGKEKGQSK